MCLGNGFLPLAASLKLQSGGHPWIGCSVLA